MRTTSKIISLKSYNPLPRASVIIPAFVLLIRREPDSKMRKLTTTYKKYE